MRYVSEGVVRDLVHQDAITDSIAKAFTALAEEQAVCFPIVRETLNYADAVFGFKSGLERKTPVLGVKAGGLWPGNAARGEANHQSTVVLFDAGSGAPSALVRATYLTALRTAAASALSIRHLARKDALCLGIIGAGGQSEFQLQAALKERSFKEVLICDPNDENADRLVAKVRSAGLSANIVAPKTLAQSADVIITLTPSRQPILDASMVKPGTHLACMGADTVGKQEVEAELVCKASLFGDIPEQAVTLGECQHAFNAGQISSDQIVCLGAVISGEHQGRSSEDEITLFDSTGMALQDLAAAQIALDLAIAADRALTLP